MFAIAFTRAVVGRHLLEVNPCFDRLARDRGFYRDELIAEIAQRGAVWGCPQPPAAVRAAFPTAAEIAPEWHLRMQAAAQRHVDAAVSKAVNLPVTTTVDDVRAIYLAASKANSTSMAGSFALRSRASPRAKPSISSRPGYDTGWNGSPNLGKPCAGGHLPPVRASGGTSPSRRIGRVTFPGRWMNAVSSGASRSRWRLARSTMAPLKRTCSTTSSTCSPKKAPPSQVCSMAPVRRATVWH